MLQWVEKVQRGVREMAPPWAAGRLDAEVKGEGSRFLAEHLGRKVVPSAEAMLGHPR